MRRSEVAMLLTMAKATDDRVTVDEGRVEAWHWTLDQEMDYEFAKKAMLKHYANHTDPVMPADINELWRIEKDNRDRIKEHEAWVRERKELEATAVDGRPYLAQIMEKLTGINNEVRLAVMGVSCPRCHANPGIRCTNIDGRQMQHSFAHPSRFEKAGVEAPQAGQEAANG